MISFKQPALNQSNPRTVACMSASCQQFHGSCMQPAFNGLRIAESAAYNYLRLMMDKSLTYADHIKKTLKEASSRVKLLSKDKTELDASVSRNNI